jgi:hypothetical protein
VKIVLSKCDFLISNCSDLDAALVFATNRILREGVKLERKVDKEDGINIVLRGELIVNPLGK